MKIDIHGINDIALQAGEEIIKIYNTGDFETSVKKDKTPLTLADKNSHDIIKNGLCKQYPEIPVISEEDKFVDFTHRKQWKYFWLVDPLDGTKEFINRNGEFTINIALIKENTPILGVIYVPAQGILYYADKTGAYKSENSGMIELHVNTQTDNLTVVKSRSHSTDQEDRFYSNYNVDKTISAGSSLKFCLVAEGKASIYYRSGPTWEWDTAAGHAIVKFAGGFVKDNSGGVFLYNKETLLNNGFCASAFEIQDEKLSGINL